MFSVRRFLLAVALTTGLSATAGAQLREGSYEIAGTNPDGSTYAGAFALRPGPNASWLGQWQVGETRILGLGLIQEGLLALSFVVEGRPGIAVYSVDADGSLRGTWTTGGGVGTEILRPQ